MSLYIAHVPKSEYATRFSRMLNITIVTKGNRYCFTAAELRGYIAGRHKNRSVRWRITHGYAAVVLWADVDLVITARGKLVRQAEIADYWASPLSLAKQMLDALDEITDKDLIETRLIVPPAEDGKEWQELICYRALLAQMVLRSARIDEYGNVKLKQVRSRVPFVKVGSKWYRQADGSCFTGENVYDLFLVLNKDVCGRIVAGMAGCCGAFEAGIADIVAGYCDYGWGWGPNPAKFREVPEGQVPAAAHDAEWVKSVDADIGFIRPAPWWDE